MKKVKFRPEPEMNEFHKPSDPLDSISDEPFEDPIPALQTTDMELDDLDIDDEEGIADFILPESYHIQEDPFLDAQAEELGSRKRDLIATDKALTKQPVSAKQ